MLISLLIAIALGQHDPFIPISAQRGSVRYFVQSYDAAVAPGAAAIDRLYKEESSSGPFYPGDDTAVKMSTLAQAAKEQCGPTVQRIASLKTPALLPPDDQNLFRQYTRVKAAAWKQRCVELSAYVDYYDNPTKTSTKARLHRASKQSARSFARAKTQTAPVFKRLKIKAPDYW